MISAGEVKLTCPAGMVLQKPDPDPGCGLDEPAFCIGNTAVTQEEDNRFWGAELNSNFKRFFELVSGGTKAAPPLIKEVVEQIVAAGLRPQPEGNIAGPRKPAVLRTWYEARKFCQSMYPGGNLPTSLQFRKASCTASGALKHQEAIYDTNGPADVDGSGAEKRVNGRGVQGTTRNVWQWMEDQVAWDLLANDDAGVFKVITPSGSRLCDSLSEDFQQLQAGFYGDNVGFRCVAPALSVVEGPPWDSKK